MPSSARIEELKRKFDENPRRFFAHLANEYRKAGDLEQAIAICRAHVAQQPDYVSGHIVFGQALYESGAIEEARPVFESALKLDPENLIALRHLGDIARAQGDLQAARGWYQRVLDADPRNEEIAEQLKTLDAEAPAPEAAAESAASDWGNVQPDAPSTAAATPATLPTSATSAAPAATEPPARTTAPIPLIDINTAEFSAAVASESKKAPAAPTGDGFERSEPLDLGDMSGGSAAPAASAPQSNAPSSSDDLGLETMEFVPPPRGGQSPARAEGLESPETPFASANSAPPTAAPSSGAGFVTETMAELYLQQGFRDEALAVYRQLLEQSPNDSGLRERVEQLASGSRSSVGIAAVSESFVEAAQQRQAARQGRSIRSFFGSLAARRVPQSARHVAEADTNEPASYEAPESTEHAYDDPIDEPPQSSQELPFLYDADGQPAGGSELPNAVEPSTLAYLAEAQGGETEETIGFEPGVGHYDIPNSPSAPEPGLPEEIEPSALAYLSENATDSSGTEPDATAAYDETDYAASQSSASQSEASYRGDAANAYGSDSDSELGSLDSLFAERPVRESDQRAASNLAGAFDEPVPDESAPNESTHAAGSSKVAGAPTREAATELSLDHVFREPGRKSEGRRDSASFSFDQFFAENSASTSDEDSPATTTSAGSENASGGDIEQFNSWLEGLKKK